jgi:hypothetical protein
MSVRRIVLLYPTTHAVMHGSQVLIAAAIENDVIPRPKGVDADCGIALAVAPKFREAALDALRQAGREPTRVLEWDRALPGARESADGEQ